MKRGSLYGTNNDMIRWVLGPPVSLARLSARQQAPRGSVLGPLNTSCPRQRRHSLELRVRDTSVGAPAALAPQHRAPEAARSGRAPALRSGAFRDPGRTKLRRAHERQRRWPGSPCAGRVAARPSRPQLRCRLTQRCSRRARERRASGRRLAPSHPIRKGRLCMATKSPAAER